MKFRDHSDLTSPFYKGFSWPPVKPNPAEVKPISDIYDNLTPVAAPQVKAAPVAEPVTADAEVAAAEERAASHPLYELKVYRIRGFDGGCLYSHESRNCEDTQPTCATVPAKTTFRVNLRTRRRL